LIVQKYGGTSVGSAERIKRAAARVAQTVADGHDVVVTVSAMGKSTDDLIRLARESGAQRIITMHGAKKFAAILRELGLNAEHLAQHPSQHKGATRKAATEVEQWLFD
jgi:aspartate kinase